MDDEQKWILDWFNEVWVKADARQLKILAADPFQFHLPGGKTYTLSHSEYRNFLSIWSQRFRSVEFEVGEIIQSGEKTVVLYRCHATYCGGWARIPNKQQKVLITGMLYFKRQNGVITDCWMEDSSFDLYQQLTHYLD
ncbi:ester cyclase [Photobacterium nomapromontoriensis]|uniref:ester cyclase n=1 Tax=Photobacterium nomapromontoriensis TaxID=2910237 RepID=UPI003D0FE990